MDPTSPRRLPQPCSAKVAERGRLVLPLPLRRFLDIQVGDTVVFTADADGAVRMRHHGSALEALRGRYKDVKASLSKELMAERRREARHEGDR